MSKNTDLLPGEARYRRIEALINEMNIIASRLADEGCVVVGGIAYDSPIAYRAHVTKMFYGSPVTGYGVARILELGLEEMLYDGGEPDDEETEP